MFGEIHFRAADRSYYMEDAYTVAEEATHVLPTMKMTN